MLLNAPPAVDGPNKPPCMTHGEQAYIAYPIWLGGRGEKLETQDIIHDPHRDDHPSPSDG